MQKPVSVIPGNSEAPNGPSGPLPWHGPAHRAARGRAGLTGPVHHLPWRVPLGTACPLFFRESQPHGRTCWLRAEPRLATLAPAPPGRESSPQMAAGLRSSWGGGAGSFSSRTCERQRRGQARHARWTGLLWPGRRVRASPPGGSPAVGPGVSKEQGDLGRMASDED